MKLTEASAAVLDELHRHFRYRPHGRRPVAPPNGDLWFTRGADGGHLCAVCGTADDIVTDHCHRTGFIRGRLCRQCNLHEARHDGPVWDLWATQAPELENRQQHEGCWGKPAVLRPRLTADELATLPIAALLRLYDERAAA